MFFFEFYLVNSRFLLVWKTFLTAKIIHKLLSRFLPLRVLNRFGLFSTFLLTRNLILINILWTWLPPACRTGRSGKFFCPKISPAGGGIKGGGDYVFSPPPCPPQGGTYIFHMTTEWWIRIIEVKGLDFAVKNYIWQISAKQSLSVISAFHS